jgi:serine phosphatase RsbU (regulator of sigma subunit)/Tfp pilus assembly protein PilF
LYFILNTIRTVYYIFAFLFIVTFLSAQNLDSLLQSYKTIQNPKQKTYALLRYAEELLHYDFDSAYSCANSALLSANILKDEMLIAESNIVIGYAFEANGKYKEALKNFLIASDLCKKNKSKPKLAQCYTAMGIIYWYQGFHEKAEEYYKKNISLCLELNDVNGLAASYGNLAILFDENYQLDSSLVYYKKALSIFEKGNKPKQTAACLDNMSIVYKQKQDFTNALSHNFRSYELRESINDTIGMLASMGNLGSIFIAQNKPNEAIEISERVLKIAQRLGSKEDVKYAYVNLRDAYELKNDYKSANKVLNLLMLVKDSLRNLENASQIAKLETKYKTKEKETELSEIKLLQKIQREENLNKLKQKNYFIIVLSIVGVFVLIIAFMLFKRFKEKQQIADAISKKNEAIEKQKTIIDHAYLELSEKNKDITDSIRYAKRIQEAIFPSQSFYYSLFPNSFVLFQPKDIVSGDFYWFEKDSLGNSYVAVVDCTGHGVPGAFMSIVGFNLLNNAIHEHKCSTPAQILNQINKDLNETLKQTEEESSIKDGMEISICKWSSSTNELIFAGANTIIYKICNNTLETIKGNKHPVGSFYGEQLKPFTDIKISINPHDTIYMFSDGYADQFGGEKGKKYKYKKLEDFLLSNSNEPVQQQKKSLEMEFAQWKGNLEQVDDVCVIGIRF